MDIATREDIENLVNTFYDRVKIDNTIGLIFHQMIGQDWSHHLPIMYSFWSMVLLETGGYTGNPVKKHIEIDKRYQLTQEHFTRWMELWNDTVDNLYQGPKADEAKKRALLMKDLISMKVQWAREGKTIQ